MNSDQKFLQLCSEKTLQANEKGFFLHFAETVAQSVGEKWIKNVFGKLKTDKERIRAVYENEKIRDILIDFLTNVQEIYRKKCPQTAKKRFVEAETQKSLNLYNQCILKAPETDPIFALSLLKRAKLLVTMDEFTHALSDTQLALKHKIFDCDKFDAYWIMAICYKALNNDTKSKISLNLAEKFTNDESQLSLLRQSMMETYRPKVKKHKELPPVSSGKLRVEKSNELGRYMVANTEIKTGEVLVVEPASVACLVPEKFGTHCQHCLERILAPVGCPHCVGVAFCTPSCRDTAISSYHKYECKFLDLLIGSGMSVLSLTALRIITQKTLAENLDTFNKRHEDALYNLCTNATKRQPSDFLQRVLMATFLLRCLQKSGYFGHTVSIVPTEQEYQIGEMLLHYLQVLQFNAHEIYETLYKSEGLKNARQVYIGVAVYPTVALFNHGCYPSVTRCFNGSNIIITATRPLGPNTPISENYGPVFTRIQLKDRQRSLSSRYWFNCGCNACVEDWPLLSDYSKRLRCPTVNCTNLFTHFEGLKECPNCAKTVSLEKNLKALKWCEEQYKIASQLMETKKKDEAIKVLCDALNCFHRVSAPPHAETHKAEDVLRICLADSGNCFNAF